MCEFSITSYRYKPDGMKEESTFEVEAGGRLGETIAHTVKQGVGLRIVGRVREVRSGARIVAEHVEIKRGFTVL
jgi:single-stranded DNA-binding protein